MSAKKPKPSPAAPVIRYFRNERCSARAVYEVNYAENTYQLVHTNGKLGYDEEAHYVRGKLRKDGFSGHPFVEVFKIAPRDFRPIVAA